MQTFTEVSMIPDDWQDDAGGAARCEDDRREDHVRSMAQVLGEFWREYEAAFPWPPEALPDASAAA